MFAPPVAKPKAKTASNDISPFHRATPFGQRHGDVEQAPMFGPLPWGGASAHGTSEQDARPASMSAKGGPPRLSWNFSSVPAYLPGREKRLQMPPVGLAPRLPFQAKLKVGAVDDPLEHEADRIADQVMRMPELEGEIRRKIPFRFPITRRSGKGGSSPGRRIKSAFGEDYCDRARVNWAARGARPLRRRSGPGRRKRLSLCDRAAIEAASWARAGARGAAATEPAGRRGSACRAQCAVGARRGPRCIGGSTGRPCGCLDGTRRSDRALTLRIRSTIRRHG